MVKREPVRPSPKLQALLKDFQAIAGMAGYLTHQMDPPQLRMIFTLYARILAPTEEAARERIQDLQTWCDRVGSDLREGSSAAVLPPQVLLANPQHLPSGMWLLVATMNFTTKVTDASYQRVRTAVLRAYKRALTLRDKGLDVALHLLDQPEVWEAAATGEIPLLDLPEPEDGSPVPTAEGTPSEDPPSGDPPVAEPSTLDSSAGPA